MQSREFGARLRNCTGQLCPLPLATRFVFTFELTRYRYTDKDTIRDARHAKRLLRASNLLNWKVKWQLIYIVYIYLFKFISTNVFSAAASSSLLRLYVQPTRNLSAIIMDIFQGFAYESNIAK